MNYEGFTDKMNYEEYRMIAETSDIQVIVFTQELRFTYFITTYFPEDE